MSRYEWGTMYLVRPEWTGGDDADSGIVDSFEHARSHFEVAKELSRLVGDEERARRIDEVMLRPYDRAPRVLKQEDITELLRLLEGLEDELVGSVVDKDWHVRPEQLPDLRRRTETLDLDESRGEMAIAGVGEGMWRVVNARQMLQRASTAHMNLAID